MIAALSMSGEHVASPKIAKIIALGRAMVFCTELSLHELIFECDAKSTIEEVNLTETSWAPYGQLLEEMKSISSKK